MIEYIQGKVDDLQPAQAVLEAGGVGYLLYISLNTYTALQGKDNARLYAYEAIREDAHLLYGFATRQERDLFLLLISVSGVGGQTARMILSAFTPAELVGVIQNEDARVLKSVKGIGPKAAARIIVDLKDKIAALEINGVAAGDAQTAEEHTSQQREVIAEAVAALSALGFSPAPSQKVAKEILKQEPDAPVERIIKLALKMS